MTQPTQAPARRTSRSTALDANREFADIYDRMGQLVNLAFGDLGLAQALEGPWVPLADVSETDDAYVIQVDLPGVDRNHLNVELNDRELVINGDIMEQEEQGRRRRRKGRRTGRFEFRTTLPSDIKADAVSGKLSDGVLTVTVPKSDAAKPRRVEITG